MSPPVSGQILFACPLILRVLRVLGEEFSQLRKGSGALAVFSWRFVRCSCKTRVKSNTSNRASSGRWVIKDAICSATGSHVRVWARQTTIN